MSLKEKNLDQAREASKKKTSNNRRQQGEHPFIKQPSNLEVRATKQELPPS